MQAKLIREVKRLVRDRIKGTRKTFLRVEKIAAGEIIHGRNVHLLCLQGIAIPFDKDCREKVQMSDEDIIRAAAAYDKAELGITKDDEDAFDRGLMRGYRDDKWIPGPNYYEGAEDEYYDDEDDDDD